MEAESLTPHELKSRAFVKGDYFTWRNKNGEIIVSPPYLVVDVTYEPDGHVCNPASFGLHVKMGIGGGNTKYSIQLGGLIHEGELEVILCTQDGTPIEWNFNT